MLGGGGEGCWGIKIIGGLVMAVVAAMVGCGGGRGGLVVVLVIDGGGEGGEWWLMLQLWLVVLGWLGLVVAKGMTMVGTKMLGGGGEWWWGIKIIGGLVMAVMAAMVGCGGGRGWSFAAKVIGGGGEGGERWLMLQLWLVVLGWLRLVVAKVDSLGDHDSEDEVALVGNEMADFMASKKVGYGTNCLLEQWKETFENNNYDFDPYDDDMYEGQDMSDKIQAICDNLDIKEFNFGISLMGKAKDVFAIPNLPRIISKEGFQNVKLSYLGGMWVLFEFYSLASKEKFLNHSEDDQDDLFSDGESQEGDVTNKADNNESDVDRVSESSFMHENDAAQKDAKRRWIKELYQKHKINFVSIQETKAESISLHTIKDWGNQMFNHVVGSSVGCSGAPITSKLLIISVYAPQELNERRDLWDYLRTFIDRWEGDTVIMGDFNEVRSEHERFGSTFNRQGDIAFNNFISLACLIDLSLEGYAFTWAHKSASKMSKLDRYLISEGVLDLFSHLSALCLDRHLSDHRPILLRETNYDYGPFPFWKINIQQNMSEVDKLIDQGKSNDEILIKRIMLLNDLQELNNRNAMEISQKAKIRWSIEGDENSKYFHGIMNKKRSQLAIRGTLANGEWISEQHRVKNEFFTHFKKQFSPIQAPSICFDFTFLTRLSSGRVHDLERTVTYEEVKRAVWDCGTNKSPGPDGFSFEFYCKYWITIDDDVFQAIRDFFVNGHFPRGSAASLIGCSILTAPFNYLGVKDACLDWLEYGSSLKKNGGLGVSSFFAHNRALLFKWVWRFLTDSSSLWTRFIKAILGKVALKVLYKRLYALEMCKSISVAEKMGHPSLSHSFRMMPRGGVEQKNYGLLCSKVADLVLPNILDRWCWCLEGLQEFSVKSSRILIDNTILPKAEVPTRWLRVVPIK
nr:RNA-directed DNA polymerase, eukaryota [Tanacetum cinerariifolium]